MVHLAKLVGNTRVVARGVVGGKMIMVDVGGIILVLMRRMSDSVVDRSLPTSRAEHIKNLFSR